jgi:hypothetical protein
MRILSRLPERRTAHLPSAPVTRKRFEPTRSGAWTRAPRELPDGIAPARGIALALGVGAAAWLALIVAIVL